VCVWITLLSFYFPHSRSLGVASARTLDMYAIVHDWLGVVCMATRYHRSVDDEPMVKRSVLVDSRLAVYTGVACVCIHCVGLCVGTCVLLTLNPSCTAKD
jgi:hypothetical protein